VEGAIVAGNALADDFGFLVDENGHDSIHLERVYNSDGTIKLSVVEVF
jgi:hypothetical protein